MVLFVYLYLMSVFFFAWREKDVMVQVKKVHFPVALCCYNRGRASCVFLVDCCHFKLRFVAFCHSLTEWAAVDFMGNVQHLFYVSNI